MKRFFAAVAAATLIAGLGSTSVAAADTTTDGTCTDGSGRAWEGRVSWGSTYTDSAGVRRITVSFAGWTTKAGVVTSTYSRVSTYNGAGGWEETLEASYPNVDYGGGTIYKSRDPRDPRYYSDKKASVKITLGSGAGTCYMTFVEPTGTVTPPPPTTASDKLPDLVMRKISDVSIDTTSTPGRKKLRFTTVIGNRAGHGPMEVTGTRPAGSTADMTTVQRIYRTDGTTYTRPTAAVMYFAGDGHTHWHTRDLARFNLHSKTSTGAEGGVVRTQQKHGFCFYDNYYFGAGTVPEKYATCGTDSAVSTQTMGLESGWADRYGANLVDQYVDITGLADGTYRVRLTVDADNWFRELDETNNSNWTDLKITGNTVTVGASGGAVF